ncbi:hypothetical protein [Streptomyces californicus]|uniref:hypothetical protein n=1 Tax=Streptomyces californicus TaxID=67351 RepID=UPI0033C444F6
MSDEPRPPATQRQRCQGLHSVYRLVALFAGCGVLMEQPVMWLFALPITVLVAQTRRLARSWARAALRRRAGRATAPARAGWLWGAAAALLDAILVTGAFAVCTVLLLGHGDALALRGRAADYLALAAGAVFAGLHAFAHRVSVRALKAQPKA